MSSCCTPQPEESPRPALNEWLRGIAGMFVLATLLLGRYVHPGWYLFTAFVGLNLLQSAFTRWCPMMALLRRLHVRE